MLRRRFIKDQRGVQAVEFAILLPVLLLLVFGIIDFGRAYFSWMIITNGAREGARAAAVGKPADAVAANVQNAVGGLYVTALQTGSCSSVSEGVLCITGTNVGGLSDQPVTVRVRYNFSFIVLSDIVRWVGASTLSSGVFPLTAEATMRLE